MEENNQFNYQGQNPYDNDVNTWGGEYVNNWDIGNGNDDNVFSRFFNPGMAEFKDFNRQNYFMDKQNAFQEYMFDKANEYNTPAAQMERAKAAGINPALAASGIMGGGNATAAPMTGASGNSSMNVSSANPLNEIGNSIFDMFTKGTNTANELGKLFGFGKENKANIKVLNNTAEKLAAECDMTKQETKRLKETFKQFLRESEANAEAAEQNVKNLQKLWDKYEEERKLLQKQQNLVTEQENTQKEETRQKQYQNWEYEFKKQFREMFGVQINDSDMSMLVQAMLSGHGQQIIDAFTDTIKNGIIAARKAIKEETTDKLPEVKSYINEEVNEITKNIYQRKIDNFIKEEKKKAREKWENNAGLRYRWGNNYEEFEKLELEVARKKNEKKLKKWNEKAN